MGSRKVGKKARVYKPEYKFRVVMDTYIKDSVAAVARHYDINANQVSTWRRQFMQKGHIVFQTEKTNYEKNLEKKVGQLENLLGKKELEIALLKKYLDFYVPEDGS